jgi:hypothetical protein
MAEPRMSDDERAGSFPGSSTLDGQSWMVTFDSHIQVPSRAAF